jgi:hypothetical protein
MATPGGLEPPTNSLEGCCSNPLSYGAIAAPSEDRHEGAHSTNRNGGLVATAQTQRAPIFPGALRGLRGAYPRVATGAGGSSSLYFTPTEKMLTFAREVPV